MAVSAPGGVKLKASRAHASCASAEIGLNRLGQTVSENNGPFASIWCKQFLRTTASNKGCAPRRAMRFGWPMIAASCLPAVSTRSSFKIQMMFVPLEAYFKHVLRFAGCSVNRDWCFR